MNLKLLLKMMGNILFLEAIFLAPAAAIAAYDLDRPVLRAMLITMAALVAIALTIKLSLRKVDKAFYAREGFFLVAVSWLLASAFGALPFYLSGEIPSYLDAFFETVSGFTTTGASILRDVEALSRANLYWRSFTHWLGGMGILVFMLAVLPSDRGSGQTMHVLRAESPGPSVEKIAPKTHRHASILYGIYIGMTVLCLVLLLAGGMPVFESFCITFGTAGTGGYGVLSDSMASYSVYSQVVVTIFMALFGINFNFFYLLLLRRFRDAFKDEELRAYIGIMVVAILVVTVNISRQFDSFGSALHHAAFSVSSVMTTTGFATVDFNLWPELSRGILVVLMVLGASAGSTGGGIKISRLVILVKAGYCELRRMIHPRSVVLVKMNGRVIGDNVLRGIYTYLSAYAALMIVSFLIVSTDNFTMETNLTAVISCLNNIGPGLGAVGPVENFADFSAHSKIVLCADMLLGRLEIFPILLLFHPRSWNRAA